MVTHDSLRQELLTGFQRLVAGDYAFRLVAREDPAEENAMVAAFNAVAADLEKSIGTMQASEQRLTRTIDAITAALLEVGSGNLDVRVERDFLGDPIDVLAFLVDSTIGEMRVMVAENDRRSAEIQTQLEVQVKERTVQLTESEKNFRLLFEASPIPMVLLDPGTAKVLVANQAAANLLCTTAGHLLDKPLPDFFASPDTSDLLRDSMRQHRNLNDLAFSICLYNGIVRWVVMNTRHIQYSSQAATMITFIDLSAQKKAETEMQELLSVTQEQKREIEQANRAKSTFLANMSHEIRTPMNAVLGMTGLLLNTPLTEKQLDFVETIRVAGDSLLTIINDILDFSKIEAGKLNLEHQPLDLRTCIESVLDLLAQTAASKHLELVYTMAPGVPAAMYGDLTRVRQILVNLVSNALKFTERGEVVVTIRTEPCTDSPDREPELHVVVADTGIGIPPERLGQLFQSFNQVDASTTRKYGGTGLGLAISKRLAEMMRGRIWAESAGLGKGATFHLVLPFQEAPAPVRAHLYQRQPQLTGKRVLIVDDNPTNRTILLQQTQTWGMIGQEAASGTEAVALLQAPARFDVGILDMHMPEMDGLELGKQLKEKVKVPFPLIMLSSLGNDATENPDDHTVFAAFLSKPTKPSQLFDVLISVLSEHQTTVRILPELHRADWKRLAERLPLRILLAEDVVVNQKFAVLALGELGYSVDVAANGLEVLIALRRQHYDVVLMDVQMPEMDGLDTTRHIRKDFPPERQPRIIAMTANALQGDREMCLQAGMDDYVSKPIYMSELQAALRRCGPMLPETSSDALVPIVLPKATPPQPNEADLLDLAMFSTLTKTAQGRELVDLYCEEGGEILSQLQRAVVQGDATQAGKLGHGLKGSSSYVGAKAVQQLSQDIEKLGKAGERLALPAKMVQLEKVFAKTVSAMEQALNHALNKS
jgi:PAS domain S-box-containing protein